MNLCWTPPPPSSFEFVSGAPEGKIDIVYCPTKDMVAGILTKPATKVKLNKFKKFPLNNFDYLHVSCYHFAC